VGRLRGGALGCHVPSGITYIFFPWFVVNLFSFTCNPVTPQPHQQQKQQSCHPESPPLTPTHETTQPPTKQAAAFSQL